MSVKHEKNKSYIKYLYLIFCLLTFLQAEDMTLLAPDGSTILIHRDEYGVPHINADNESALFFGQGFAEAHDRLYQIDLNRRAATGRLAEWFGDIALEVDKDVIRTGYTDEELLSQFYASSTDVQNVVVNYVDGINAYVDTMQLHQDEFMPLQYRYMDFDTYSLTDVIAFASFMARMFGKAGGEELSRLNELQNNGWNWFNENWPIIDSTCTPTIPNSDSAFVQTWLYSGMTVPEEVVLEIEERNEYVLNFRKDNGIIYKGGSFAAIVGSDFSTSGNVLLLGCPQLGGPDYDQPSRIMEIELECPTLHAGGGTIPGLPLVVQGHNEDIGWTWTSGVGDNVDTYIDSLQTMSLSDGYWHNGEWLDFEVITDTIYTYIGTVLEDYEVFTHHRTIHGPVIGAYTPLKQVYSHKMTFWSSEWQIGEYVYKMNKASNIAESVEAIIYNPFSFNVFVVDNDQNIGFWYSGYYQDRNDGVHPYLPHKGDGTEEWVGLIPFEDLPQTLNHEQDYITNFNNKPSGWWINGDIGPWISDYSICDRVDIINDYMATFSSMSLENIKSIPYAIGQSAPYRGAYEFDSESIIDYNLNPPGISDLVHIDGTPSLHKNDQWSLHEAYGWKDMIFGEETARTGSDILPNEFKLFDPYPNPFNPVTNIKFSLNRNAHIQIDIIDITGRLIDNLVDNEYEAGQHTIPWVTYPAPSGVYFVRLSFYNITETKKLLLLK